MTICSNCQYRTIDVQKYGNVPFSDLWMVPADACALGMDTSAKTCESRLENVDRGFED